MNGRIRALGFIPMLMVMALVALVFLVGCEREEPVARNDHAGHDHAAMEHSDAQEHAPMSAGESDVQTAAIEQTTCPVMEGNAINKDLFVEYKGKKVYFCCAGCPEKFLENPEQYVAKLPQFQDGGGETNN